MALTTCSMCVLAGSAGGVVAGFCLGRRRRGRRAARPSRGRATMRAWPGRTQRDADGDDAPGRGVQR